jgi:hypothetical protein
MRKALLYVIFCTLLSAAAFAQETYFVTYSHQMEEPGNLEIENKSTTGSPAGGNTFVASSMEFEYGVKGWWTSEFYLDGQSTHNESTVFTGYRWENRFRPLLHEHWINPVIYTEFEDINGADKSLLEVVGHDGVGDLIGRNDRSEKEREIELKLILSSNTHGWNISENFISEKNLAGEAWEFGYALGVSRPLSLKATARPCSFCRENISAGVELYGGLGDFDSFGLKDTSHYIAPVVHWQMPNGPSFKVSPGFGLNDNSMGFHMRFGVSYEIEQIFSKLRRR